MRMAVAFGICVILISIFAGEHGLPAVFQARRQAQELSKDIERLRAENARLRRGANALQADRGVIERVARETLGLARADELVVFRRR